MPGLYLHVSCAWWPALEPWGEWEVGEWEVGKWEVGEWEVGEWEWEVGEWEVGGRGEGVSSRWEVGDEGVITILISA